MPHTYKAPLVVTAAVRASVHESVRVVLDSNHHRIGEELLDRSVALDLHIDSAGLEALAMRAIRNRSGQTKLGPFRLKVQKQTPVKLRRVLDER